MVGGQRTARTEAVGQRHDLDRADAVDAGPGGERRRCLQRDEVLGGGRVDGDREAAHLQRGHQRRRADDVAEAAGDRGPGELVGEHRHLQHRGAAEVVEDRHLRPVAHQRAEAVADHDDRRAGVGVVDLLDARLAVNAEPELGLAGAECAASLGEPGTVQVSSDMPMVRVAATIRRAARVTASRSAPSSASALAILWTKSVPARPRACGRSGCGDVVVDDDHRHLEPEGAGALGGEAEVETVAGVVLDDEEAPRRAGDGEDRREDGVDRGRGEDVAAGRGRQHPRADEAGVGRLVPRPAAGDERDAAAVPVGAHDDADVRIAVEPGEAAAGVGRAARRRPR